MLEGPESGIIPLGIVYGAFSAGCPKNFRTPSCLSSALMTAGGSVKKTSAALLAASILLAGCSGDTKPDPSSSSTTGSSPATTTPAPTTASPTTASPTPDPNIPAAARAHTPAGAEAFVRYFIERLNIAWTAPRAGILSPLCQASSKACAAYEKTAARLTTQRHHYDGPPVTIGFVGALDSASLNHLDVVANVVQERRSEIDAAGKTYVTDKRQNLRLDYELLYTGQAWSVASVKIMK
jgi:hypothetical protein